VPTKFIMEFGSRQKSAMEIMTTTLQGVMPDDDDVCTAIAMLTAVIISQQWRVSRRNALPIIVDRLKQCFSGKLHEMHAEMPIDQMFEEAGLGGDSAAETALLRAMMRETSDAPATERTGGKSQRRAFVDDL